MFNLAQFYKFCSELKIETKEHGLRKMDRLLGTQTYIMDEIARGLQDDIHFFVILKGRQLGITTISLALDLYWHFVHPGLQGTLTTDTEENRDMFRSTLSMYIDGLPREYKVPVIAHNRNHISLKNRSRLFYQVAGLRSKGSLGRGKAITYLHGTETSSWGDEEGLASLLASLAETNPQRLYLFESTARGFNMFHDMYVTAKKSRALHPECFRYAFGAMFQDTDVLKSTEKLGTLKVWEQPIDTAYYVIGADPAYGSSDWADRFSIQVFRVYANGMEQVAEFATSEMNTYQFAWVIAHLAGAYKNSTLNLEVNGPGQAVINEMRNLKRLAAAQGTAGHGIMDVLGSMQNYIWRRNDTMSGLSNSIGFLTTSQTKERMLTYMKDYFERGLMEIKSMDLLDEMKGIVREGGFIGAPGRGKDDRVIASALAAVAYAEQVQPRLIAMRLTKEISHAQENQTPEQLAAGRNVSDYLKKIGMYGGSTH